MEPNPRRPLRHRSRLGYLRPDNLSALFNGGCQEPSIGVGTVADASAALGLNGPRCGGSTAHICGGEGNRTPVRKEFPIRHHTLLLARCLSPPPPPQMVVTSAMLCSSQPAGRATPGDPVPFGTLLPYGTLRKDVTALGRQKLCFGLGFYTFATLLARCVTSWTCA